jgi:hypothetical protein
MSADRTLFLQFVNMAHSRAVGGAVNSYDEPETCMEATEVFPDTNAKLVVAPEYEGQSPSWIRCHQDYIERTARPDFQNRDVTTSPLPCVSWEGRICVCGVPTMAKVFTPKFLCFGYRGGIKPFLTNELTNFWFSRVASYGMNPEDVLHHIKGFDDKGRKLLPQAYKNKFWVAMTPIQRKKLL